jgi:hypothetical protein
MHKVGDLIDGFCRRCRLNTNQIVSATDGNQVFTATCQTCKNTDRFRPEVAAEDPRESAWKKLARLQARKSRTPSRVPEVIQRGRRSAPAGAKADSPQAGGAAPGPPPTPTAGPEAAFAGAVDGSIPSGARERWREVTGRLKARHGKPYYPYQSYASGDVLLHKRHGMGVVEQVLHDRACTVLFREGLLVLEMGMDKNLYLEQLQGRA